MGAEDVISHLSRASVEALARARGETFAAWEQLRIWRHGDPDEYTTAGQNAITHINQAISHLEHARGALLGEMELVAGMSGDDVAPDSAPPPQPAPDVTGHPSGAGPDTGSPGDFLDGSISIATPGAAGPDDGSSR